MLSSCLWLKVLLHTSQLHVGVKVHKINSLSETDWKHYGETRFLAKLVSAVDIQSSTCTYYHTLQLCCTFLYYSYMYTANGEENWPVHGKVYSSWFPQGISVDEGGSRERKTGQVCTGLLCSDVCVYS